MRVLLKWNDSLPSHYSIYLKPKVNIVPYIADRYMLKYKLPLTTQIITRYHKKGNDVVDYLLQ